MPSEGTAHTMPDPYWTRTDRYDPHEFHRRYGMEMLDFWVPRFVRLGRIEPGDRVVDLGCGTGGFSAEIARRTRATVIAVEPGERLIRFAASAGFRAPPLLLRAVAEALPIAADELHCVLMSLVLHQIEAPEAALRESRRVLEARGRLVVRSVNPEIAQRQWFPFRFFPKVAEIEAARMIPLATIRAMCRDAGFSRITCEAAVRNTEVRLDSVKSELSRRTRPSYALLSDEEIAEGLRRMERGRGRSWMERKSYVLVVAEK